MKATSLALFWARKPGISVVYVALAAVLLTLSWGCDRKKPAAAPPTPVEVTVIETKAQKAPMTLSLAVVFIPIMFMAGILGRVLNEMAVTITLCILVSGFVTLSLTPMLCSRFLSGKISESGGFFKSIERAYEKSLHFALRFRFFVMRNKPAPSLRAPAVPST